MNLSTTNAVWECPTERHHNTETGLFGECRSTRCAGIAARYGEAAAPSTEVWSTPSLTIIASIIVPAMIDWPTSVCAQAAGLPSLPSVGRNLDNHIGRE